MIYTRLIFDPFVSLFLGNVDRKLSTMDRPPPSRGGHQRLPSIDNDDWAEDVIAEEEKDHRRRKSRRSREADDSSSHVSSGCVSLTLMIFGFQMEELYTYTSFLCSDITDDEAEWDEGDTVEEPDERTSLLPPTGISSNEYYDAAQHRHGDRRQRREHSGRSHSGQMPGHQLRDTVRIDNTTAAMLQEEAQVRGLDVQY